MYWFLNKKTNAAEIYGGITAILRHEKLEKTEYKSRFSETFSRKKLKTFEDDCYRIEKKSPKRA